VQHVGVVSPGGRVLENDPVHGERVNSLSGFAAGKPVRVHRTNAPSGEVVQRARSLLANPKRYDLLKRNCEHTANEVIRGRPFSPQVAVGAVGLLFITAIFLAHKTG
jgi:hypothetical protein